jgi:hypothetical protein
VIASPNISRGQLVEQLLVIDAGQAVGGENRPGAVSEQSLEAEAVIGGGDHGPINGKSAVALPCQHLRGIPFVEEIVSHQIAENTSADHLCEGVKAVRVLKQQSSSLVA